MWQSSSSVASRERSCYSRLNCSSLVPADAQARIVRYKMKNYDGQSRNPISPITISHCLKRGENAQVMALSTKPENSSSDRCGAGHPIRTQRPPLAFSLPSLVFLFQLHTKSEVCGRSCLIHWADFLKRGELWYSEIYNFNNRVDLSQISCKYWEVECTCTPNTNSCILQHKYLYSLIWFTTK
jgi:hypothetical protein